MDIQVPFQLLYITDLDIYPRPSPHSFSNINDAFLRPENGDVRKPVQGNYQY